MGFHRVHMRASDDDHITVDVPLNDDGTLDPGGHQPWLLKALWDGTEYLGELQLGASALNRVVWDRSDDDSLTDFGTAVIKRGALVTVHATDANSRGYLFTVLDVRRV